MQRLAGSWRRRGRRVALVPTMGFLHEGHLSLIRRARRAVGSRGIVAVSLYVNPAQFAAGEDLSRYPRDLPRDTRLCRAEGVDVLFAPDDASMYPAAGGGFSTLVEETAVSRTMEGASRPTHFRGVTTVVGKLLHITQPDLAVFGAKDFQQAAVVRRMIRDLNFPVKLILAPTVREPDGLALSSRNNYLSPDERAQATILSRSIRFARARVRRAREPIPAASLKQELRKLIATQPAARVDYLEFFHAATFEPAPAAARGIHFALAVFVGRTRLIDNGRL